MGCICGKKGQTNNVKLQVPDQQPIDPITEPENDDFYLTDVMRQFDDLTLLFSSMEQEFENMSQYLSSISGEK